MIIGFVSRVVFSSMGKRKEHEQSKTNKKYTDMLKYIEFDFINFSGYYSYIVKLSLLWCLEDPYQILSRLNWLDCHYG